MTRIIAIDGPSGVGKSSVSKALADKLNYNYVDTGAIYRTIALIIYNEFLNDENLSDTEHTEDLIKNNIDKILNSISKKKILMDFDNGVLKLLLDNKDISKDIRTEKISVLSSIVSKFKEIRDILLELQRDLAVNTKKDGAIIDGRDIGTVVFPDADVKIFLTASAKERANRRYKELLNRGVDANFAEVLDNIIKRDENDINRTVAPLKKADDALEFNTDSKSFEKVLADLLSYIQV